MRSEALLNFGNCRCCIRKIFSNHIQYGAITHTDDGETGTEAGHRIQQDSKVVAQVTVVSQWPRRFKGIKIPYNNICNRPPTRLNQKNKS